MTGVHFVGISRLSCMSSLIVLFPLIRDVTHGATIQSYSQLCQQSATTLRRASNSTPICLVFRHLTGASYRPIFWLLASNLIFLLYTRLVVLSWWSSWRVHGTLTWSVATITNRRNTPRWWQIWLATIASDTIRWKSLSVVRSRRGIRRVLSHLFMNAAITRGRFLSYLFRIVPNYLCSLLLVFFWRVKSPLGHRPAPSLSADSHIRFWFPIYPFFYGSLILFLLLSCLTYVQSLELILT